MTNDKAVAILREALTECVHTEGITFRRRIAEKALAATASIEDGRDASASILPADWAAKHYTGDDWPIIKSAGIELQCAGADREQAEAIAGILNRNADRAATAAKDAEAKTAGEIERAATQPAGEVRRDEYGTWYIQPCIDWETLGEGTKLYLAAPISEASAPDYGDRAGFEAWSKREGACNLEAAHGGMCEDGRYPATYHCAETETAWRAWANKPAPQQEAKAEQVDYEGELTAEEVNCIQSGMYRISQHVIATANSYRVKDMQAALAKAAPSSEGSGKSEQVVCDRSISCMCDECWKPMERAAKPTSTDASGFLPLPETPMLNRAAFANDMYFGLYRQEFADRAARAVPAKSITLDSFQVPMDSALNEAGWAFVAAHQKQMGNNPEAFNWIKPMLQIAIDVWLRHPENALKSIHIDAIINGGK